MELPNAILLCARHGFERLAVDIDRQRGVLGVVRDEAPGDGQAATLRHAELVLDSGPELARREAKCFFCFAPSRSILRVMMWSGYFDMAAHREPIYFFAEAKTEIGYVGYFGTCSGVRASMWKKMVYFLRTLRRQHLRRSWVSRCALLELPLRCSVLHNHATWRYSEPSCKMGAYSLR